MTHLNDVAENFVRRIAYASKVQNESGAFTHDCTKAYSYNRLIFSHASENGQLILKLHPGRGSVTTSKHINAVLRAARQHGFKVVEA